MKTNVEVKESKLTDGSKVYDVILKHGSGRIEFEAIDAKQAN
jgi:hypothetical protein